MSDGRMRFIHIEDIKPGMMVGKTVLSEKGTVLLHHHVKLTKNLITRIQNKGLPGLYIEDELSKDVKIDTPISEEAESKAIQALRTMDIDAALNVAQTIVEELCSRDEISINLISLRTDLDDTYKHSVNVAVLSAVMGMGLALKESYMKELTASALLHDIGKLNIPRYILDKPGTLTIEEYEIVKEHAELGYERIKSDFMLSSKIKMGIYSHHENINGTGYPLGLVGDQIFIFAKIIHIADVYDALVSERPYKRAYSPIEAIKFLTDNGGKMFEDAYVKIFLKHVPLYPKGRNVVLSTGEVAVVIENSLHHTLTPLVRTMAGVTIDLSLDENLDISIVDFESNIKR
ncbi:MAG: HD-GYP domain-containing protein, partial [Lachnoclostridium sp.]|nr:HD-GYP domain-containing protein [Lachnoclostridium sp.]